MANRNYTNAKPSNNKGVNLSQLKAQTELKDVIAFFNLPEETTHQDVVNMMADPKAVGDILADKFSEFESTVAELDIDPLKVPAKLEWVVLPKGTIFRKVEHPSKPKLYVGVKPYSLMGIEGLVNVSDILEASDSALFTKNAQLERFGAGFRTSLYDPSRSGDISSTDLLGAKKIEQIVLQGGYIAQQTMGYWNLNVHPLFEGMNKSKDPEKKALYTSLVEFVQHGLLKLNSVYMTAQSELFGHLSKEEKPAFISPRFTDFPQIGTRKNVLSICAYTGYPLAIFTTGDNGDNELSSDLFKEVYSQLFQARPAREFKKSTGSNFKGGKYNKPSSAKKSSFTPMQNKESDETLVAKPTKKGKPASAKAPKVTESGETAKS